MASSASAAASASATAAAAAAAAAAVRQTGGAKSSLDDIVSKVQKKIPSMTKEAILFKIDIVRKNNNGTIRSLTLSSLIDQIRLLNNQGSNPVLLSAAYVVKLNPLGPFPTFNEVGCCWSGFQEKS